MARLTLRDGMVLEDYEKPYIVAEVAAITVMWTWRELWLTLLPRLVAIA